MPFFGSQVFTQVVFQKNTQDYSFFFAFQKWTIDTISFHMNIIYSS